MHGIEYHPPSTPTLNLVPTATLFAQPYEYQTSPLLLLLVLLLLLLLTPVPGTKCPTLTATLGGPLSARAVASAAAAAAGGGTTPHCNKSHLTILYRNCPNAYYTTPHHTTPYRFAPHHIALYRTAPRDTYSLRQSPPSQSTTPHSTVTDRAARYSLTAASPPPPSSNPGPARISSDPPRIGRLPRTTKRRIPT